MKGPARRLIKTQGRRLFRRRAKRTLLGGAMGHPPGHRDRHDFEPAGKAADSRNIQSIDEWATDAEDAHAAEDVE